MLLISLSGFIVLIVVAILSIGSIGFCSWYYFMNELNNTASQNKEIAENIFFLAVVEIIVFFIVFICIALSAKQRRKKLEKISELNNVAGNLYIEQFKFLKNLGNSVFSLYSETSKLSELRAKKIKFQNKVIHEIMQTIDVPVLLINVKGVVLDANQPFLESSNESAAFVVGAEVNELFKDFDFSKTLKSIAESKLSETVILAGVETEIFPVFNSENEIGGIIAKLKKSTIFSLNPKTKVLEKKTKVPFNFLKNLNSSLFHK